MATAQRTKAKKVGAGTWRDLRLWLRDAKMYSPTTALLYVRRARAAERWINQHHDLSLWHADADVLFDWYRTLPPTSSSRNIGRQALHAYFEYRIWRTTRTTNPADALPIVRPRPPVPKALTRDEAAAVLDEAERFGPDRLLAVSLLLYSALRATEARTLRWDQLGDGWITVRVKGGDERSVPMAEHTIDAAQRWQRQCPSPFVLFPSPVLGLDRPISDSAFRQRVEAAGEVAGVTLTPHVLRHTCATRLLERGVNIRTVQAILGHSQLNTTMRYLRIRPANLPAALGRLDFEGRGRA